MKIKKFHSVIAIVLCLSLIYFFYPNRTYAAISLVASTCASGTSTGVTTSALNTTGANFIVIENSYYQPNGAGTVSDSKGNTWTALTAHSNSNDGVSQLYYAKAATVGTGHTFSISGATNFPSLCVMAFSGVDTVSPFDAQSGNTAPNSSTSVNSGAGVTPGSNNEVVIAAIGIGATFSGLSVNGSFTGLVSQAYSGGNNYASGMAYLVQTSAALANPTWSWTGPASAESSIASFRVQAAASSSGPFHKFVFGGQEKVILNGKNKYIFQ